MAEGGVDPLAVSLQKLDDELTCPVCTDHFKEPKVLPCLHYYCKTCIADLIKRAKGRPFHCPQCRREVQAQNNDVNSFPTAFFMNRMEEVFSVMQKADQKANVKCESCSEIPSVSFCHDCKEYICAECVKAHKQLRKLSSHKIVSIESIRSNVSKGPHSTNIPVVHHEVTCTKHVDEPLKLYCHDCHILVCHYCILIDHKDHRYAFVTDAAPLYKAEIRDKVKSVKEISKDLKATVKSLGDSEKKLLDHESATVRAIDNALNEVAAKVAQRRKELKERASRMMSEAREKVSTQEKNAQLAVGEVESLLEFMSRSLERATDQEVLSLEKQMSDQVERVTQLYDYPADKFPVPEIPELIVYCGVGVKKVVEKEISVIQLPSQTRLFKTEEIEDERIGSLPKEQERYLQREARKMQLTFHMDRNLNIIELKGSKESISEMKFKVHAVMTNMEKEAIREKQAETMKKTVQWLRQDSNDPEYNPLTNLEIEETYHANGGKKNYTFRDDVSGEHFTIDFQRMVEIDHDMGGKTCEVRRVTIGSDDLPKDWESMVDPASNKMVPLRVIDLATSNKRYQFALAEFHKTMTQGRNYTAIVKIQRIQNPGLYGQYASKKKYLDSRNPSSVQNERWLFHGTKESAISHINRTNFNRSLRGQNGTVWGHGCYFARDASYSNRYASPDAQGQKHMYLVRVLTGEYTTGGSSMMVAPIKDPNDPTVPFDSVVDNNTNPGIFVVFFDADAYPEYLITYK